MIRKDIKILKYFLFTLPIMIFACARQEPTSVPPALVEAGFVTIKTGQVKIQEQLSGRVRASLSSDVRPQVEGIIQERLFSEGTFVQKGQVLYRLDNASYSAAYSQAKAALQSAEATVEAARIKSARYAELAKINGISAQELDDALSAHKEAVAAVAQRKAALETARINLSRTEIKAPVSGYIGISAYTPGALVTANQTDALAVIVALDEVYVDMTQSAERVQGLRSMLAKKAVLTKGAVKVTLILNNGDTYKHKGILQPKEVSVSETTGAVALRAKFPNPDRQLMPGMFVRAIVDEAVNPNGILASQRGIRWDVKGNAYAMLINSDDIVVRQEVRLGPSQGNSWVVLSGLRDGDRMIVEGLNRVRSGETVLPKEITDENN